VAAEVESVAPVTTLADELQRLPLQPSAAMRVLWALSDDETSAAELARIVEVDPALSTRIMQLANSPYYGVSGRVSSAAHAIMLLGFTMVRALAVSAACGLFVDRRRGVPDGFWSHAAAAAVGAAVVAERTEAPVSDAFSAGLLHDLGSALIYRLLGDDYTDLVARADADRRPLADAERAEYGITHAWAGAMALEAWKFPAGFVEAVGGHHDGLADPLARAVAAGDALAVHLGHVPGHVGTPAAEEALAAAGIDPSRLDAVLMRVRAELDDLACLLAW
jgi:HD-like signal output (HDOD) protein